MSIRKSGNDSEKNARKQSDDENINKCNTDESKVCYNTNEDKIMKTIFLTSNIGGYKKTAKGNQVVKEVIKCDNSNGFIDRLKAVLPKIKTFVFVASDPDCPSKTDEYANIIVDALNLDGFEIESLTVIDHRFKGNIEEVISFADLVFLSGGNVPTQNKYFKEIKLKSILDNFNGVIIGQSAGSMNCSRVVYTQPEEDEEFEDANYQRILSGLGLVDFAIMPHMNSANEIDSQGHPSVMQMCLQDSYVIPHYGIFDYGFIEIQGRKATAHGKTLLIKNGQCIELCGDKETIEIDNNLLATSDIIKD